MPAAICCSWAETRVISLQEVPPRPPAPPGPLKTSEGRLSTPQVLAVGPRYFTQACPTTLTEVPKCANRSRCITILASRPSALFGNQPCCCYFGPSPDFVSCPGTGAGCCVTWPYINLTRIHSSSQISDCPNRSSNETATRCPCLHK